MTNYLFPHVFKKIGLAISSLAIPLGLYTLFNEVEPAFFDRKVFAISVDRIFESKKQFAVIEDNILNEILGIIIILGLLFVAFAKEKVEDEYIGRIRLESLVWATYFNYAVLIFSFIFFYEFTFLWVMVFNMFTILVFFIIRFNWKLYGIRKSAAL